MKGRSLDRLGWLVAALACWSLVSLPVRAQDTPVARPVVVGSKPFGESYLLAELFAQILELRVPVIAGCTGHAVAAGCAGRRGD